MTITLDQLQRMMPASKRASLFLGPLNTAMDEFKIDTPMRQAMFLANVGAETGQLSQLSESLSYRAERIREIGLASGPTTRWRSLVPRAAELAGSPERMGNALYGGRMGNGAEATGDGYNYRGRGGLQTTGKNNYVALMMGLGIDCLVYPELLEDPLQACRAAGYYWWTASANRWADAGDFDGACDVINIGRKTEKIGDAIDYAKRLALFNNGKGVLLR